MRVGGVSGLSCFFTPNCRRTLSDSCLITSALCACRRPLWEWGDGPWPFLPLPGAGVCCWTAPRARLNSLSCLRSAWLATRSLPMVSSCCLVLAALLGESVSGASSPSEGLRTRGGVACWCRLWEERAAATPLPAAVTAAEEEEEEEEATAAPLLLLLPPPPARISLVTYVVVVVTVEPSALVLVFFTTRCLEEEDEPAAWPPSSSDSERSSSAGREGESGEYVE